MSAGCVNSTTTVAFDQTPVRAAVLVPLGFFTLSLAIVVVALRLYTRHFLTKKLWWDDAIILLALMPSMGLSVASYYGEHFGWGHHVADIPPEASNTVGILKTLWLTGLFLTVAAGLTKCSILFFYLRITAAGAHPTLRNASFIALVLVAIWTVTMTIVSCVQCVPISNFWAILDYSTRLAACAPWAAKLPLFLGQGITNTIGDFAVVLLPAKYILSLQLPMKQKSIVVILFLLGIFTSIAGIIRLIYITRSFDTFDTTWSGILTFQLGCLEVHTGVICASIPAIKPLVVAYFPRFSKGEGEAPYVHPKASIGNSSQFSGQPESTADVP